jgi:hypothetical protein
MGSLGIMGIRARTTAFALAIVAVGALAGCGQSGPPEKGLLVSGPGVHATQPPWAPQYAGLAQRIKGYGPHKAEKSISRLMWAVPLERRSNDSVWSKLSTNYVLALGLSRGCLA